MKKMVGITLIIVGALTFIIGLVIYYTSNKHPEQIQSAHITPTIDAEKGKVNEPASVSSPIQSDLGANAPANNADLEKIINMAVADGVLTNNEQSIIKELTDSKGLDYTAIIKNVQDRLSQLSGIPETEIVNINKKQGDNFEKFIVQKFNKDFFNLKGWAGDKFVNGTYAQTTQHPDLLLELDIKKETAELAVECKWRSSFYKGGIEFANSDQFKRYQDFENRIKVPVFIAIGVGGSGAKPDQLFVVPLKKISSQFIHFNVLSKYEKRVDTDFFYDIKEQTLR